MWLANQVAAFSMAVLITTISEPAEEPRYGLEDCFLLPNRVCFQVSSSRTIVSGLFVTHRRRRPHEGIDLVGQSTVHVLS